MRGQVVIPREAIDFEVAHRVEAADHYLEISAGSSFNELYWDIPTKLFLAEPERYEGVAEVLEEHGASWVLDLIPGLARGEITLTTDQLREMAAARRTER